MKSTQKTLLVATLVTAGLFSAGAFAGGHGSDSGATVYLSTGVGGKSAAGSYVSGVNDFSKHNATAASWNKTTVTSSFETDSGTARRDVNYSGTWCDPVMTITTGKDYTGTVKTTAETVGGTLTKASGFGDGYGSAQAGQEGFGKIKAELDADDIVGGNGSSRHRGPNFGGELEAESRVHTNTGSNATVVNNGVAFSGSFGKAENESQANVKVFNGVAQDYKVTWFGPYKSGPERNVTSINGSGSTDSDSFVKTFGWASGHNDSVNAGGMAHGSGEYEADVSVMVNQNANLHNQHR